MSHTITVLSAIEIEKFLAFLDNPTLRDHQPRELVRNLLMAVIMLDAGLRVGELVKLDYNDVIINGVPVTSLVVRAEIAKLKIERSIPCSNRIRICIETYWDRCRFDQGFALQTPLFWTYCRRSRITVRQVQRIIKEAGNYSIGRPITPHQLRHTFATRLMEKSNIRVVQALLGHKSLQSTQIYTHPNNQHLRDAIDKI